MWAAAGWSSIASSHSQSPHLPPSQHPSGEAGVDVPLKGLWREATVSMTVSAFWQCRNGSTDVGAMRTERAAFGNASLCTVRYNDQEIGSFLWSPKKNDGGNLKCFSAGGRQHRRNEPHTEDMDHFTVIVSQTVSTQHGDRAFTDLCNYILITGASIHHIIILYT